MPSGVARLRARGGQRRRLVVALAACGALLLPCVEAFAQAPPPAGGWAEIEGSWSVRGTRQTLPTGGGRPAAILHLSGAVVLTAGDGLSRGFLGEAIGFDDGEHLSVGRSVFTDANGDCVFVELRGDRLAAGNRLTGTVTGGTGRYAGVIGDFTMEWQYVVETEEGAIEARGVRMAGRYRRDAPGAAAAAGAR